MSYETFHMNLKLKSFSVWKSVLFLWLLGVVVVVVYHVIIVARGHVRLTNY